MTEKAYLFSTNGTGDGATPYTQAEWSTIMMILAACGGGVMDAILPNYENQMEGSVTGANTVSIDTGGAIVDGKVYNNTAAVSVTIPSAVGLGNTRIDRIVLRCNWSAQTVRVTRIAGVDAGSPVAPAITTTRGTTYDIYLCRALVDTGGTVTVTDERGFIGVVRRQGGDTADWNVAGATNYVPGPTKMEVGCVTWTGGAAASGSVTVTFPRDFDGMPLIFATVAAISGAALVGVVGVAISDSQAALTWYASANQTSVTINWMAFGW